MDFVGYFALVILVITILSVIAIVVWLAMLPGKIAFKREHAQAEAIQVAGWLGILTGIVWVFALIWAYTQPESREAVAAGDLS